MARVLAVAVATVVVAFAVAAVAVLVLSGVSLDTDPVALARVHVQTFGGTVLGVRATAGDGSSIPLSVNSGRMTPQTPSRRASGSRSRSS